MDLVTFRPLISTVICNLHFGQKNGSFTMTVSGVALMRVFPPHRGQYTHVGSIFSPPCNALSIFYIVKACTSYPHLRLAVVPSSRRCCLCRLLPIPSCNADSVSKAFQVVVLAKLVVSLILLLEQGRSLFIGFLLSLPCWLVRGTVHGFFQPHNPALGPPDAPL